jgi:Rad3-related DNA helicase
MAVLEALLPAPSDMGLPAKFAAWRPGQDRAVIRCVDAPQRFKVMALPTGAGKSASCVSVSILVGGRTVILTSTKALQGQYMADFASMGMVEVKGQNAYPCRALTEPDEGHLDTAGAFGVRGVRRTEGQAPPRQSCDEGPCHLGMSCKLRNGGCHYYDAVRAAEEADLVVTNYAFWLAINEYRKRTERDDFGDKIEIEGIGKFDLLVLDEAHDAPEALSSFLTVTLTQEDVEGLLGATLLPVQSSPDEWARWATYQCSRAEMLLEAAKEAVRASQGADRTAAKQVKALRQLVRTLAVLQTRGVEWVVEEVREDGGDPAHPDLQFAPVWPAPLAEQYLFRKTGNVLLVSATVRPKTLDYLGIDRAEADFFEERSTFPIARRPIIHIPTAKLTHAVSDMVKRQWVARIGQIMRARPGVRGIIHAHSYDRARYITDQLGPELRRRLLWHRSSSSWQSSGRTLAEALEEFRTRPVGDGLWLISPAVTTGYDFADDQCRVQIIVKVPFPDSRSEVVKARTARDADYGMYLTMQTLVQSVGRSTRSETDWSETFVVDDQVLWLVSKYGKGAGFAPKWFLEAYRSTSTIPPIPTWATDLTTAAV